MAAPLLNSPPPRARKGSRAPRCFEERKGIGRSSWAKELAVGGEGSLANNTGTTSAAVVAESTNSVEQAQPRLEEADGSFHVLTLPARSFPNRLGSRPRLGSLDPLTRGSAMWQCGFINNDPRVFCFFFLGGTHRSPAREAKLGAARRCFNLRASFLARSPKLRDVPLLSRPLGTGARCWSAEGHLTVGRRGEGRGRRRRKESLTR